jgi:hypothetical protein
MLTAVSLPVYAIQITFPHVIYLLNYKLCNDRTVLFISVYRFRRLYLKLINPLSWMLKMALFLFFFFKIPIKTVTEDWH